MRRCKPSRQCLLSVGIGQAISLLISGTGVCGSLLAAYGANISSTQALFNYALLLLTCATLYVYRAGWATLRSVLREDFHVYFFLAACDVEANFLVTLAYQFTSLSSVMLIDCLSIPSVMVLRRVFLKKTTTWLQLLGSAICVLGVVALVVSDWLDGTLGGSPFNRPLLGDGLCAAGAILYR